MNLKIEVNYFFLKKKSSKKIGSDFFKSHQKTCFGALIIKTKTIKIKDEIKKVIKKKVI
jgi:hypothetical protein